MRIWQLANTERLVKLKHHITMLQVYVTYALKSSQEISCMTAELQINKTMAFSSTTMKLITQEDFSQYICCENFE
jgi:hypothetical protein